MNERGKSIVLHFIAFTIMIDKIKIMFEKINYTQGILYLTVEVRGGITMLVEQAIVMFSVARLDVYNFFMNEGAICTC